MSDEGSDNTDETTPNGSTSGETTPGESTGDGDDGGTEEESSESTFTDAELEERYRRILREEAIVTDGDLRLEVAKVFERAVTGDDEVLLGKRYSYFRGPLHIKRKNRTMQVHGSYHQDTGRAEVFSFKDTLKETVEGGVFQQASVEAEHIIGGTYTGMWLGPMVRIAAWADYLAWGGWADTDASRIEIVALSIRAYMGYAHLAAMRVIKATMFVDDWQMRTENFGTFIDNQLDAVKLGGPGSGMENHA